MNILITGGGTGGHLYPGLELARHFSSQGHRVFYIACKNEIDKKIIKSEQGLDHIQIFYWNLRGIRREIKIKNIVSNIVAGYNLLIGMKKAKYFLKKNKIEVVIGVGGYVSYPALSVASKLGIKTIIHEQNSYPGFVNRKLSKNIDIITGAYNKAQDYLEGQFINVANPRVDKTKDYLGQKYYDELGLNKNKKIVLFLGGSLGANTINELFSKFIKSDKKNDYQCILISGLLNNKTENLELKDNIILQSTNKLLKYIATSDYVISRGGATTLLEIIYLEKKSIIIPSPNVVQNHQYLNAQEFSKKNLIYLIEENKLEFDLFLKQFEELKKDIKIEDNLKKYNKILSLEMFDKLIRS